MRNVPVFWQKHNRRQTTSSIVLKERLLQWLTSTRICRKAYEQAEVIITNAKKNAREIDWAPEYADNILNKVEEILEDTLDVIKVNRNELK